MAQPAPSDEERRTQFPLFPGGELDFFFEGSEDYVLMSDALPNEHKRRLAGAWISAQMGYKSVDYVLNRYLKDQVYPDYNPTRPDRLIRQHVKCSFDKFQDIRLSVESSKNKPEGLSLACFTLIRSAYSAEIAFHAAQQGALYETICCHRMMLEQLCFANSLSEEPSHEFDINKKGRYAEFSCLDKNAPKSGRFYGWLSAHAHWIPKKHVNTIQIDDGKAAHIYASVHFKMISFLSFLVLLEKYSLFWLSACAKMGEEFGAKFKNEIEEIRSGNRKLLRHVVNSDSELASCLVEGINQ